MEQETSSSQNLEKEMEILEWSFAEEDVPENEKTEDWELTFAEPPKESESSNENPQNLFEAVRNHNAAAIRNFAVAGSDVNAVNTNLWSVLQTAAFEGNLEVVQTLLELGALPDPQWLCVFFAAQSGNTELVRFLLNTFQLSASLRDPDGNTLLHYAAESHSPQLLAFLLALGADPNVQGAAHLTALERAAWVGDLESVRTLVEAGAEVNSEGGRWSAPLTEVHKTLCEAVFLYGPPIYAAASQGHLAVVKYLVLHGADVNARDCRGRTVLHAASRAENPDVMQFLQSLGAE